MQFIYAGLRVNESSGLVLCFYPTVKYISNCSHNLLNLGTYNPKRCSLVRTLSVSDCPNYKEGQITSP